LLFTAAVLASLGPPEGSSSQLEKRCFAVRGDENNVATAPAVAAVRSAERNKFFPSKRTTAVATGSAGDLDACFVDKPHGSLLSEEE
jgi:hypothetical protein